ncbi:MAG: phosphatase PAP2 family protein [Nevskiales bacterium]
MRISMRASLLTMVLIGLTTGCGTPAKRPPWGSEATYAPGWSRLAAVTQRAVADPHVWAPLIGAGLFSLGNADEAVSEWAIEESPLFSDIEDAGEASDTLLGIAVAGSIGTALLAPSGETAGEIALNKSKGLIISLLAAGVNDHITGVLKDAVGRKRPDGQSDRSFPSRHASGASVSATLAAHNLEYFELGDTARSWLGASLYSVAGLTGWARIEGARHFPSDVLFGYALGHFLGVIANEAFIAPISNDSASVQISGDQDQVRVGLAFSFQ